MEILKPSSPQIFSSSPLLSLKKPIIIYINKNPSNLSRPFFKFLVKPSPFSRNLSLYSSRNLRVSAHIDRPIKRRKNSLRKKLVEQQVRENLTINHDITSTLENPVRVLDDNYDSMPKKGNFNAFDNVEASKSSTLENPVQNFHEMYNSVPNLDDLKVFDNVEVSKSNSVLYNQLESWVDQYKADAEFWGIGGSPIFTVFRDSNGKVEKVDVNEDEVLRRSQTEPSIYKLKDLENVKVAKSKISHAKFLAREMEIGNNVIPTNSSVAKFVNSKRNSGFRESIQGFVRKPGVVPKLSKVGISVSCGLLVFLILKSFFTLRKAKGDKARMVKAKSVQGSVEVIQKSEEPEILFTERPKVDKEELLNNILKLKASNDYSGDCDSKIQEIRGMARDAREIERTDALAKSDNENDKTISDLPTKKEVIHIDPTSYDVPQGDTATIFGALTKAEKRDVGNSDVSEIELPNDDENVMENKRSKLLDAEKVLEKNSVIAKPRIIKSVKEAREYLFNKKHEKQEKIQEAEVKSSQDVERVPKLASKRESNDNNGEICDFSGNSALIKNKSSKDEKGHISEDHKEGGRQGRDAKGGEIGRVKREEWMEENFHEFDPIVEKIRGGFRNNYMVAREKVKEDVNIISELNLLEHDENDNEFEWMKDEKLREIVFQVRENELMGRDPFYLMDAEDKALFFKGLEKKVEKENEKLCHLHEYLHSNIENLDYGADGISVHDPPEKIIPRWKGPPPTTSMSQESLDDYLEQRKALFAETFGNSNLVKGDLQNSLKSLKEKDKSESLKSSKTVIEGSDGSIRAGKKSGKEFWEHTKKWSRGFIESYNAENDPEIKAVMKDIGKDLDRWITEKEIQEAADIMDKVPEKGKSFIHEKINKVKREMELFGPQAVVSKYSEYGEDEEFDYYWWLDLPFVLCIELYIDGDGGERIGFYSLEMASDLELDPKPHHIIAFEDVSDCKNLCYIIQAHMEMLGSGNAFVVAQSPKDTYREARTNGFNVSVIRKGELQLNVDQTLEEVEEQIAEIGSKMYHDKIMKGRNVDMDSMMNGVFGFNKSPNRRSKKLKKPTK